MHVDWICLLSYLLFLPFFILNFYLQRKQIKLLNLMYSIHRHIRLKVNKLSPVESIIVKGTDSVQRFCGNYSRERRSLFHVIPIQGSVPEGLDYWQGVNVILY